MPAGLRGVSRFWPIWSRAGARPLRTAEELEAIGYHLSYTPGAMVRALTFAAQDFLKGLKDTGSTAGFAGACSILRAEPRAGLDEMKALGPEYDPASRDAAE